MFQFLAKRRLWVYNTYDFVQIPFLSFVCVHEQLSLWLTALVMVFGGMLSSQLEKTAKAIKD